MEGTTYWDPAAKKNVDVTLDTPLPVGGATLGAPTEGLFGEPADINAKLATIYAMAVQVQSVVGGAGSSFGNDTGSSSPPVYVRGDSYGLTRAVDGAFTDNGKGISGVPIPGTCWGLQVTGTNGAGAAVVPTAWDVRLELTLDGVHFDEVLAHATGDGNGKIKTAADRIGHAYRVRVAALTRGPAADIVITVVMR